MQKKIIVTLGRKKIANFFVENLSESPKIAIVTLIRAERCTQFVDGREQGDPTGGIRPMDDCLLWDIKKYRNSPRFWATLF
jgi:hypothetical protein